MEASRWTPTSSSPSPVPRPGLLVPSHARARLRCLLRRIASLARARVQEPRVKFAAAKDLVPEGLTDHHRLRLPRRSSISMPSLPSSASSPASAAISSLLYFAPPRAVGARPRARPRPCFDLHGHLVGPPLFSSCASCTALSHPGVLLWTSTSSSSLASTSSSRSLASSQQQQEQPWIAIVFPRLACDVLCTGQPPTHIARATASPQGTSLSPATASPGTPRLQPPSPAIDAVFFRLLRPCVA